MNFDDLHIGETTIVDYIFINDIKDAIGDYVGNNLRSLLFIYRDANSGFFGGDIKYKIKTTGNTLKYMFMFESGEGDRGHICDFDITVDFEHITISNLYFTSFVTRTINDMPLGKERKTIIVSFSVLEIFYNLFHDKLKFNNISVNIPNNVMFRIDDIKLRTCEHYLKMITGATPKIVFDKHICLYGSKGATKYEAFKNECKKLSIKLYYDCSTYQYQMFTYELYDIYTKTLQVAIGDVVVDTYKFVSCNNMENQKILLLA